MMKKLTLSQKINAISALAVVCLLVLATNKMDSNHFAVVKKTLATVYEDRLVAQDYIYKLSNHLQNKRLALSTTSEINTGVNDSLNVLIDLYAATKLTTAEKFHFGELKKQMQELYKLESSYGKEDISAQKEAMISLYNSMGKKLDVLSKIQLDEGKRQIDNSNRSISTSDLLSQIEIGILIIIGLIVQAIIFFKPLR